MRKLIILTLGILVGIITVSIITDPIERIEEEGSSSELGIDPKILTILERSCFDCHSNQVNLPWYGSIFPVNYYLGDHIREGRESLNFMDWKEFNSKKKDTVAFSILEEVEGGSMPPKPYLFLHPEAVLSEGDWESLKNWQEMLEIIYEKESENN